MRIEQVENMTAEELAAKADELALQLAGTDPDVLALRYVKARLDAKVRDEKLAEQAETLTALKDGMEAIKQQAAASQQSGMDIIAELNATLSNAEGVVSDQEDQITNISRAYEDRITEMVAASDAELDRVKSVKQTEVDDLRDEITGWDATVAQLNAVIARLESTIAKLTDQANTYVEVISLAQEMFLKAMHAKAIADAAVSDAS